MASLYALEPLASSSDDQANRHMETSRTFRIEPVIQQELLLFSPCSRLFHITIYHKPNNSTIATYSVFNALSNFFFSFNRVAVLVQTLERLANALIRFPTRKGPGLISWSYSKSLGLVCTEHSSPTSTYLPSAFKLRMASGSPWTTFIPAAIDGGHASIAAQAFANPIISTSSICSTRISSSDVYLTTHLFHSIPTIQRMALLNIALQSVWLLFSFKAASSEMVDVTNSQSLVVYFPGKFSLILATF